MHTKYLYLSRQWKIECMHGEGITNYSKNIYISILEFTVATLMLSSLAGRLIFSVAEAYSKFMRI